MNATTTLPASVTWLSMQGVAAQLGYTVSTVEKLRREESFPKPVYPHGNGDPRWNAAEVDAWMRSQPRVRAA